MKKKLLLLPALFVAGATLANEMFAAPPTDYVISGKDIDGKDAYQIHAVVNQQRDITKLTELSVSIYDDSISIDSELLEKVQNPDFANIMVSNDIGVFGSFFYIRIPFGDSHLCSVTDAETVKLSLFFDNLPSPDGGGLQVRIVNPCDHK